MRVCLDGRSGRLALGTGVATYAGVLEAALPLAGCVGEVLVEGADRGRMRRWLRALGGGAWVAPLSGRERAGGDLFRTAQVEFDLRRRFAGVRDGDPPDVMHWTYPMPLRFLGVPNVYTVHDLIPLLHPALTPVSGARMRRVLAGVKAAAAHVVTVSEASRAEIIGTLGLAPELVTNTYQAVVTGEPGVEDIARVLGGLGLVSGEYYLHVGTVERRKNVGRLIAAHRASGVVAPLVLAGPEGWGAAAELKDGFGVVRVDWMARTDLSALIRGARGVLAPSLAEGFGLAIAESMALGVPVLTSAGGATAEVAGGSAVLVDPLEVGSIAEGLRALDGDAGLRARLVGAGLVRARLFSVEAYAGRLAALYARVLDR